MENYWKNSGKIVYHFFVYKLVYIKKLLYLCRQKISVQDTLYHSLLKTVYQTIRESLDFVSKCFLKYNINRYAQSVEISRLEHK